MSNFYNECNQYPPCQSAYSLSPMNSANHYIIHPTSPLFSSSHYQNSCVVVPPYNDSINPNNLEACNEKRKRTPSDGSLSLEFPMSPYSSISPYDANRHNLRRKRKPQSHDNNNNSKRQKKIASPVSQHGNLLTDAERDHELKEEEELRIKNLERNRLAASKCRQKKKEWMDELARKAERMAKENEHLRQLLIQLKEETLYLKTQLLMHKKNDFNSCEKKAFFSMY